MNDLAELNELTKQIIGAPIQVHRHVGPGLLESAYETCLAYELRQLGLNFEQQKALPFQRQIAEGWHSPLHYVIFLCVTLSSLCNSV